MSKARQLADLGNVYDDGALSNRNLIINGAMQVAQRGTSTSTINAYLVDRFRSWGGGVHTMSRTDDISTYPNSRYALRIQRNSGSTDTTFLGTAQGIESANCLPIIGKTVTLSFKAKAGADFSAASGVLVSSVFYGTGNDQNPLAMTGQVSFSQSNTLTTSVQTFTQTVSIPSSARQVSVAFSYTPTGTAGANDWYETTEVQLEVGDTATPFEHRSYGDELARCQRYYRSYGGDDAYEHLPFNGLGNGTVANFVYGLDPEMRVAPTLSTAGTWSVQGPFGGSVFTVGSWVIANTSKKTIRGEAQSLSGSVGNNTARFFANNSTAVRFSLDAEL